MAQSINLIPHEEKQEQEKEKLVKVSTILSVLLLLVAGAVAAYFFNSKSEVQKSIATKEAEIEDSRAQIKRMSDIEIVARNLFAKYKALNTIFDTKFNYSLLLEELRTRTPSTIKIDDLTITATSSITISGSGDNYLAVAQFINDLTDENFEGGHEGLENLFSDVVLNSVNLESKTNRASYFMNVSFRLDKLAVK
ncbi:hypothetical protein A3F07_03255 [candidate division WWE3 bacterium RIFCSPHIGHO2_12_FULL_38_15]|uniref:PilN domain-containing protein n=1 Tax=candidate division WWE3 bacterium RIFCSPHIGHO2_02_FULL_38_14 TaxID=1802620 RepID=A0A1F4V6G9_UNCKA|nr:MAG: hypothetical protein A2793_03570 [candidate division WWE3 bacterium RIFCSPHIGHO2_01_FULL_38_45]OGC48819.1 MAG: hypothetical protein A3F07_03255 [candidate division WWE3 bacterium RIFCSPHIGHO2_12_FULL_38_15]OGC52775.1 MAG: hypothetical protein A3D91_01945 [candidate division WWE3 bacterium RIFCSPHIGHO2_02_FULL_38_14]OGC53122.1 MAG: hypothetical protein A3B64_01595 [candidate division WWE3 bacterium RIFCSPLOWO2_01_FULL_37_24]HLB51961.1 PilN domain-containing protein [Patescibacteria group